MPAGTGLSRASAASSVPAGRGSSRVAPTRCAQNGIGWCWPWPPCWRSPTARVGRKPPPWPGPRTAAHPPRRLSLLRQGMACLGALLAQGRWWMRVWLRPRPGPYGPPAVARPGPGTLTRNPASVTQRPPPTPRLRARGPACTSPTQPTRTHGQPRGLSTRVAATQRPGRGRMAGGSATDPPHPEPHIYLSRAAPSVPACGAGADHGGPHPGAAGSGR